MEVRTLIKKTLFISVLALVFMTGARAVDYSLDTDLLPKKVNSGKNFVVYGRYKASDYSDSLLQGDLKIKFQGKTYEPEVRSDNKNNYALTEGIFWKELEAPQSEGDYDVKIRFGNRTGDILSLKVVNQSRNISFSVDKDLGFETLFLSSGKIENKDYRNASVTLKVNDSIIKENLAVKRNSTKELSTVNLSFDEIGVQKGANFIPILLKGTLNGSGTEVEFASQYDYKFIRDGFKSLSGNLYSLDLEAPKEVNVTRKDSLELDLKAENNGIPAIYNLEVESPLETELSKKKLKLEKGGEKDFELEITAPEELKGKTVDLVLKAEDGKVEFEKKIEVNVLEKHGVVIDKVDLNTKTVLMGATLRGEVAFNNTGDFDEVVNLEAYFRGNKPTGFGSVYLGKGETISRNFFLEIPKAETGKKEIVFKVYGEGFGDRTTKTVSLVKESKSFRSGLSPNSVILGKEGKEVKLLLAPTGTQANRLNISVRGWDKVEGLGGGKMILEPGDYKKIPLLFKPQKIEATRRNVNVKICSIDTGSCNTHDLEITLREWEETYGNESVFNLVEKQTTIKPGQGALINLEVTNNHSTTKDYRVSAAKNFKGGLRITEEEFSLSPKETKELHVFLGTEEDLALGNYTSNITVKESGEVVFEKEVKISIKEEAKGKGITGAVTSLPIQVTILSLGAVFLLFLILRYVKKRREEKEVDYETYKRR